MSIFDGLKNFFNNNKNNEVCPTYHLILAELIKYEQVLPEVKMIQKLGHTHFLTSETEAKILKLIEEDESAITIQNESGTNIGMYAADLELENIVLRVLDNEEASLQQDNYRMNIGMIAAENGLEKAVLKALDNDKASIQVNCCGQNIGMYAAIYELEDAVIKSLDNPVASLQQDSDGTNIGMTAAWYRLNRAVLKALDNEEASVQQEYNGYNIGMMSAQRGLEDCVLKALDNKVARNQVDKHKNEKTIADFCLEQIQDLPLSYEKAIKLKEEDEKELSCKNDNIESFDMESEN